MIEVRSISKFYGNKKAVDALSFGISEGEIVGLLGLNGAGKSTILKMLGCFLVPSQGDAFVGGHSVIQDPDAVRRMIGYLPDTPPLYNEMKTQSYLEFVAQLKNVSRSDVNRLVGQAIEKTNLREVAGARISELSHGFRQRVGIAQALVHQPKVLILDEPINGLDPIQIVEMRDLVLSLKGQHTLILSSHILSEITKTCDRILVIDRGRLVAEGTEAQLRGKGASQFEVLVEIEGNHAAIASSLSSIPGVTQVQDRNSSLILSCSHDVRPEIARKVIEAGGRLLTLNKKEAELETLFLKLVKGEGVKHV